MVINKNSRNSLTYKTLNGFVWMFFGKGARFFLQIIVIAILARLLCPEDFGIVAAALVVVNFSEIFSKLGIGPALVQRPKINGSHIKTGFTTSFLLGVLLTGFVWFFAPYISMLFLIEDLTLVLRVHSCDFVIHGEGVVSESLLQRNLLFKWITTAQVISYFFGYGLVGTYLAYMGYGVWSLVVANLIQAMVKCIIEFMAQPYKVSIGFEVDALKELLFFGTGFTLARVFNYFATQGDNIVIGRFLGPSILGLYSRAYQLMSLPATLFGDILDKVLFPSMAKIKDKTDKLGLVYIQGVSLVAVLTMPLSSFILVLAPEIVLTLLGDNWSDIIVPIQILSFGIVFRTSYKMSESLTRATGAVYHRAWRQGVYAFLILLGTWIGHHWGLIGVSYGIVIALAINFCLMAQLSLSLTNVKTKHFLSAHLPGFILSVIVFLGVWGISKVMRYYDSLPLYNLIVSFLIMLVIVILLIWNYPILFFGIGNINLLVDINKNYNLKFIQLFINKMKKI